MAVSANQTIKRRGRDGKVREIGVAAGIHIYEGTLVFLDAGGDATDVKVDANTVFAGVARREADNTGGADGDITVEVWADGQFELEGSGFTAADRGVALHATDNYTTTTTTTANPQIGTITNFISSTVVEAEIRGIGEA